MDQADPLDHEPRRGWASGFRCPACLKDDLAEILDLDDTTGRPQVLRCTDCQARFTDGWQPR